MEKMKLEVYIGNALHNKPADARVTIFIKEPYFPHGELNNKGGNNFAEFNSFKLAGTYVCDLIDFLKHFGFEEENLKALVKLNIKSCKKIMKGYQIVRFLDYLQEYKGNYEKLREFPKYN